MSMFLRFAASLGGALLLVVGAAAQAEYVDPPSRVARLSYVRGEVSFSPAGEDEWVNATRNRPLIRGDRLWTGRGARAELQAGNATFRIDEGSSFQFLNLDDRTAQVEITQGTLNLRVRRIYEDQIFEVDTPTLAFVISRPGEYRIDVDARGEHTTVAVWDGGGEAHGERANFRIREGEAIRFYDTRLQDYEAFDIPRPDEFDRFCMDRDQRFERSVSRRYVSEDLIGYSDLDDYGSWSEVTEYGNVWFPSSVSSGWAPYRDGHWIWQDPWGWTWVDDADWGFAPFHYGRWVHVRNRWGWIPGPVSVRPVYAPALVAFVGGSNFSISVSTGRPIGWFPLGPREIYMPPYRTSRNYFTSINVTNTVINNTYITNVYNDYSRGRNIAALNYHNRSIAGAVTAVSSDTFINSRPVRQQLLAVNRDMAARAEISQIAALTPTARSVVGGGRAAVAPERAVFDRRVVARTAPAAETVPFAQRQAVLQRTPGRGMDMAEMESLQRTPRAGAADVAQRVRIVDGGTPGNGRNADSERVQRGTDSRGPARDAAVPGDRGQVGREANPAAEPGTRAPRRDGTLTAPERDFTRPGGRGDEVQRARPAQDSRGDSPGRAPVTREAPPARNEPAQRVERAAPVERQAPVRVEREAPPPRIEQRREEPQRIERREEPQRIERQAPVRVEREAPPPRIEQRREEPQRIERQAPVRVEREAPPPRIEQRREEPQRMERQAPVRVEREAPPQRIERSEPVQRSAPPPPPPPQQRSDPPPQERRGNNEGGKRDEAEGGRRRRDD
jgi:FecR protein